MVFEVALLFPSRRVAVMSSLSFVIKFGTVIKNVYCVEVQNVHSEQSRYENINVDVRSCRYHGCHCHALEVVNRKNYKLSEDVEKSRTIMQWIQSRCMLNISMVGNNVSEFRVSLKASISGVSFYRLHCVPNFVNSTTFLTLAE